MLFLSQAVYADDTKEELTLTNEQQVRLRCVEVVHGSNSSNQLEVSDDTVSQIQDMTVWCEQFILNGASKEK
jgi:hypothetical protein